MSATGEPVRIGIVGVGVIGRRHLQLAVAEERCSVVAVADPDPATATAAYGAGATRYRSCRAMLDNERVEGVIVAAPTQSHAEIGRELACRGLPMLMEKPFTDTLESGLDLVRAAASAGVAISVGHHRRFDPAVSAARNILGSGEIGRLVGVSGIWAARKPDSYFEVSWRRSQGGGAGSDQHDSRHRHAATPLRRDRERIRRHRVERQGSPSRGQRRDCAPVRRRSACDDLVLRCGALALGLGEGDCRQSLDPTVRRKLLSLLRIGRIPRIPSPPDLEVRAGRGAWVEPQDHPD